MIPIRNFPYTDYHDLNLDFLLRQFQQYEIDIEELKRRVKALEDWRIDVVEPDLLTIKGDIVNIKANIISLGDRITTNTTNINKLAANEVVYVFDRDNQMFHKGSYDGPVVTDFNAMIDDLQILNTSDIGNKIAKIYIYDETPSELDECTYMIHTSTGYYTLILTVIYKNSDGQNINGHVIKINSDDNVIDYYNYYSSMGSLVSRYIPATILSANMVATTDPDLASDYPYQLTIPESMIKSANQPVEIFIENSSDFINYSNKICEYVKVEPNYLTLYFKEQINNVSIQIYTTV